MQTVIIIDDVEMEKWVLNKLPLQKVEELLMAKGLDAETVAGYLKRFKRMLVARRQSKGFFYTVLGAFLGFISCLLTVLNPVPELYNVILFGLTSVAVVLIFAGLYFLFE